MTISLPTVFSLATAATLAACATEPTVYAPGEPLPRAGDEIIVCGELFHSGTPIICWADPGGYDAYRAKRKYSTPPEGEPDADKQRYGDRTPTPDVVARVEAAGWRLADLRQTVRQFVIHYDVCGTSRQCFKVLESRGLSVHFLLDVDGTIYQTLDLKERAWHASQANSASIGIEIAHIGAYPAPGYHTLNTWYDQDDHGTYVTFPKWLTDPGIRTPEFVARPSRDGLHSADIHGKTYWQYDFTEEQYRSLIHLIATLHRVLPNIRLDAPRDSNGEILMRALTEAELASFNGVLGHYHVTERKTDPGPAFDWERVLREARALVGQ